MRAHILKNTQHLTWSVMLHTLLVKNKYIDQGEAALIHLQNAFEKKQKHLNYRW